MKTYAYAGVVLVGTAALLGLSTAHSLEAGDTPWMTWGEASYTVAESGKEEGFKFDGYFEQGYVLSHIGGGWFTVPYVALRATGSQNSEEPWNNRVGPWVGVEARKPLDLGNGKWAEIAVGVRGGYYAYFDGSDGEGQAQAYVSFGAGGPKW